MADVSFYQCFVLSLSFDATTRFLATGSLTIRPIPGLTASERKSAPQLGGSTPDEHGKSTVQTCSDLHQLCRPILGGSFSVNLPCRGKIPAQRWPWRESHRTSMSTVGSGGKSQGRELVTSVSSLEKCWRKQK